MYRTWLEAVQALEAWGVEITGRAELGEGSVMDVGRELNLVALFDTAEEPHEVVQQFARRLDRLGITIICRSIYGDEYRAILLSGA